jgi:hypothetical protein
MFVEKMGAPVGNHIFIAGIHTLIYYIIMLQAGKLTGTFGRSL